MTQRLSIREVQRRNLPIRDCLDCGVPLLPERRGVYCERHGREALAPARPERPR
jgi:hypothetical protein